MTWLFWNRETKLPVSKPPDGKYAAFAKDGLVFLCQKGEVKFILKKSNQ